MGPFFSPFLLPRARSSSKRLRSEVKRFDWEWHWGQTKYRPCSVSWSKEQDGNRKATPVVFRKWTTTEEKSKRPRQYRRVVLAGSLSRVLRSHVRHSKVNLRSRSFVFVALRSPVVKIKTRCLNNVEWFLHLGEMVLFLLRRAFPYTRECDLNSNRVSGYFCGCV